MREGIYETEYGNAAYVNGPEAKLAYDLDMGEAIPIELVTDTFIRESEPADLMMINELRYLIARR